MTTPAAPTEQMKEDVKRVLNLEDRLFEMALKFHLLSHHESYLYECEDRACAANREALGDDLFMVKYGDRGLQMTSTCAHCQERFKGSYSNDVLCGDCFCAGHRGNTCDHYCKT
jgi:hypothetical protein